jgi:hypothetical protein
MTDRSMGGSLHLRNTKRARSAGAGALTLVQGAQMDPAQRIVTRIPLRDLWRDAGLLDAHRHGRVGRNEIPKLLRDGSTLVVADVGHPLRWIPEQDRFTFWKAEVKDHLVPAQDDSFYYDTYPKGYCYVASVWHCVGAAPVIVLEKYH